MHNRKAIITGVTGQDGSYLADLLVAKGYSVLGLTRDTRKEFTANIAQLEGRIELAHCSYDRQAIEQIIAEFQPHEVYNLAGQSFVSRSWEFQPETIESAGLVPCYILEAITKRDPTIRFFQASSSEIFQPSQSRDALNELSPLQPVNPYGCAKALAHTMVAAYRNNKKLFAVNGILFNHESERRKKDFLSEKVVATAVRIKLGLETKLKIGDTKIFRDFGYSPDYMEAAYLSLQHSEAQDYIIASGKAHSVDDLVRTVFEHLGLDHQDYLEIDKSFYRPLEATYVCGNPDKARKLLGWSARTNFSDLLKRMVDAELGKYSPETKASL